MKHILVPSVLWRCWLGGRKGIRPVKKQSGGVLVWLSVWSEVQTCIQPSWCHCHSLSLASVKSRLVLPFWCRLTRVVSDNGQLNGCVCACVCVYKDILLQSPAVPPYHFKWRKMQTYTSAFWMQTMAIANLCSSPPDRSSMLRVLIPCRSGTRHHQVNIFYATRVSPTT